MLNLLPLKHIKSLFALILILKLLVYIWLTYFQPGLLSLGGDANYYDQFAHGLIDDKWASSIWPLVLRELYFDGLYNRHVISWSMFLIGCVAIPLVIASSLPRPQSNLLQESYRKIYWHIATMVSLYPIIFFYSIDIYRDVLMALIFSLWMFVGLKITGDKTLSNIGNLIALAVLTYVLYQFRPYLGMSLVVALCFYQINLSKIKLSNIFVVYLILIAAMHSLGALDALLRYRSLDVFDGGGTTLAINLNDRGTSMFIVLMLWSGLLQLFGLYLISFKAVIFVLAESLPFSWCCWYIYKNKQYLTKFTRCIIIFSVVYATVWIIANDNLGTAVRVRIFNYLSIFYVAASIYSIKYLAAEEHPGDETGRHSKEIN